MLGKKSKEGIVLNDPNEEVQETNPRKEGTAQTQDQEGPAPEMIGIEEARKEKFLTHLSQR